MSKRKNDDKFTNALTLVVLILLLVLTFGMLVGVLPTAQETHTAELVRWEDMPVKVSYICEQTIRIAVEDEGVFRVQGSYEGVPQDIVFEFKLYANESMGIGFSSPVDAATVQRYDKVVAYILIPNEPCEVNNG